MDATKSDYWYLCLECAKRYTDHVVVNVNDFKCDECDKVVTGLVAVITTMDKYLAGEILTWPRPIPVSERMPEVDDWVLAFNAVRKEWCTVKYIQETRRKGKPKSFLCPDIKVIFGHSPPPEFTHWMPLPPEPE